MPLIKRQEAGAASSTAREMRRTAALLDALARAKPSARQTASARAHPEMERIARRAVRGAGWNAGPGGANRLHWPLPRDAVAGSLLPRPGRLVSALATSDCERRPPGGDLLLSVERLCPIAGVL